MKFLIKILIGILIIIGFIKLPQFTHQRIIADEKNNAYIVNPYIKLPQFTHPRIIADEKDFTRIKQELDSNKNIKSLFTKVQQHADQILTEQPVIYELYDGVRLLRSSRRALDRITCLSLVYKITNDKKYADRAWLELKTISDPTIFPDWHPAHYLDTAEMAAAAAIGYDWLYDYLDANQKRFVQNAIEKNALNTFIEAYNENSWWSENNLNWNAVCNGGIGLSAIAVGDENPNLAQKSSLVLGNAMKSLPIMISTFNPDGGWPEGPVYWDYANKYLSYFISSLCISAGDDYGLLNSNGYSQTGFFPIYISGPKMAFNFADAPRGYFIKTPVMFWLGQKFKHPEYTWYANKNFSTDPMSLFWYNPESEVKKPIQNDKLFKNINVACLHSSIGDENDIFVGFKGGDNYVGHADLDIGTFVIDMLGERWAENLGPDNYNLPGYFDNGKNGERWQYYRKRAEGHNTLVINPSDKPDQNVFAESKITEFYSSPKKAFAIADLTPAYNDSVYSVRRGVALVDNKTQIIIQDEINPMNQSDIWWFMHTKATINLLENQKEAILSINNKKILAKIISPKHANFIVMNATPLPTSPNPSGQENQKDLSFRKLAINIKNAGRSTIIVQFKCLDKYSQTIKSHNLKIIPLDKWKDTKFRI